MDFHYQNLIASVMGIIKNRVMRKHALVTIILTMLFVIAMSLFVCSPNTVPSAANMSTNGIFAPPSLEQPVLPTITAGDIRGRG